jgi:hypothetical protein
MNYESRTLNRFYNKSVFLTLLGQYWRVKIRRVQLELIEISP